MRRILAIALLALASAVGLPAAAEAGGPTSVLVTQPGVAAAGLYYTDEAYDDLLRLLPTDETRGKELPPGGGVAYNLTWMVHDYMPWRFDHVSVHGDGTAWVATTFSADATAGWQPVDEGTELFDLLNVVLADGEAHGLISETMAASVPAAETRTVTETEWFSLSGWRWVVPGALLGLLAGVAADRVRRTHADEPRRVLVEA
jgi:hypothetical protein